MQIMMMPMSHRIACLRDDVVFLIYLYQRYLYPVDKTRPNEYGFVYEDPLGKEEEPPLREGTGKGQKEKKND